MCEHFERIETKTKFVILMHPKEFKKVKNNTGHFTHQSLPNSELFIGVDFTSNNRINEIISTHESYILFPSKDALDLSAHNPSSSSKNIAIFLIDSTWGCTKKMFTQSQNLQKLKHMSFQTAQTSQYEIKEQPENHFLSTMESTLFVMELLNRWSVEDIDVKQLENFLNPFKEMIAYQKKIIANPLSHAVRFKKHQKA